MHQCHENSTPPYRFLWFLLFMTIFKNSTITNGQGDPLFFAEWLYVSHIGGLLRMTSLFGLILQHLKHFYIQNLKNGSVIQFRLIDFASHQCSLNVFSLLRVVRQVLLK